MKICTKCGETKPLEEFHRFNAGRDGRRAACRACSNQAMRDWAAKSGGTTDVGLIEMICRHCAKSFEYVKTTGRRRFYCTDECRYQAGQAAKVARAQTEPRRCACGSTDVQKVGSAVCPDCRRKADPDSVYARERRRILQRYGLSLEEFDAILASQGGRCGICYTDRAGGRGREWHVDHCHETNKIRGLLCHNCNVGLGNFKDSIEILNDAVFYLERSRGIAVRVDDLVSDMVRDHPDLMAAALRKRDAQHN